MRPAHALAVAFALAFSAPAQEPVPATPHVAHEANFDSERAQANQLYLAGKAFEALPLYEDLCRQDSTIAVFAERHAAGLFARMATVTDPKAKAEIMNQGMAELRRAHSLGDNSPYVQTLLGMAAKTPVGVAAGGPMGASSPTVGYTYHGSPTAQPIMQQAEAAFGHNDISAALKLYLAAFAADPRWYEPALYAGDMYARLKDYPNSYLWYAKAIAIDPDRETAYRYWGDALIRAADPAAARVQYEQAYIAEPYTKSTAAALQQWGIQTHTQILTPRFGRPQFTMKDGQFTELPLTAENGSGDTSWLVYRKARLDHDPKAVLNQWVMAGASLANGEFKPSGYVHTLAEEVDALNAMLLDLHAKLASGTLTEAKLDPSLRLLLQVQKDNLLEPFILLTASDAGLRHGYPEYRAAHRDQLLAYVNRYFIGGPTPANSPSPYVQISP